ncbi:MAG: hypothetical protein AAGB14_09950 [Verrucomicrobiota bacterium]
MRASVKAFFLLSPLALAEPSATLLVPKPESWTGQRLPFFIELRAEGTFSGSASFDLPEIPETVVIRIGNPVLSSETKDDTEVFVQRHEFALFSQANGSLELPPITARFSHKKGYSGPDFDAVVNTGDAQLTINRPPDSEALSFLITAETLEIKETWNPEPGPVKTGTVFKRSITQSADQQSGIALMPAPLTAPEGVRVYPGSPSVSDETERGQFKGSREETITYLVQEPGLHTLPEIRYAWWNPVKEELESRTLPAITFSATAPPPPPEKPSPARYLWLVVAALLMTLAFTLRRQLQQAFQQILERINPPSRRQSRAFLKTCAQNDPEAARAAWSRLRSLHPGLLPGPELAAALMTLEKRFYGASAPREAWSGQALATAWRKTLETTNLQPESPSALPTLNP